jgi:hypothetical protein
MTDAAVPPEKPVSRAAIRMARSRARRRRHLRCVTIEVTDLEIEAFIRAGDLPSERRSDPKAIRPRGPQAPRLCGKARAMVTTGVTRNTRNPGRCDAQHRETLMSTK